MTIRTLTAVAVTLAAGAVFAQEEAETPVAADEAAEVKKVAPAAKIFTVLPFCQIADGIAEVMAPGGTAWSAVSEGKFYPLGSVYRTRGVGSKLVMAFGPESKVMIEGDASFGTRSQELSVASRTIVAGEGTLKLDLARNLQEGAFFVSTPGFTIKNPAGESKIVRTAKPDGVETVVRCVTGALSLEGRHFAIPQMHAADEIRIRETVDNLETLLYGTSGDYVVKIDRGIVQQRDVDEEGNVKTVSEKADLDWHMSPKTKVRINRLLPALGERMSVAVMTFDAVGALKNNFAFAEGRAEVNSGELIKQTQGEEDAAAKKAAAAAEETTTEAPAAEESGDEDSKANKNKKEEE